jgi:hypothetical protein
MELLAVFEKMASQPPSGFMEKFASDVLAMVMEKLAAPIQPVSEHGLKLIKHLRAANPVVAENLSKTLYSLAPDVEVGAKTLVKKKPPVNPPPPAPKIPERKPQTELQVKARLENEKRLLGDTTSYLGAKKVWDNTPIPGISISPRRS